MTKYILHGGETGIDCENNENFLHELFESANKGKIVISYFSRSKDEWKKLFAEDKIKLEKAAQERKSELFLADENIQEFIQQVKLADVIYFKGGSSCMLMDKLREIRKIFVKLIENKTIAGSSAGANMLSRYYYSTDANKIKEGFGFLPIKVFAHYCNDLKGELEKLEKYGDENMKTYAIPETEFIILNK